MSVVIYRVMSVFRMAASDLGSFLQSNLAPTEIYMVRMLIGINGLQDLKNIKNVKGCRDGMPKSIQTR